MKERAYPVYTVNKHAEGLLVGGHPWVYENDITAAPETLPENGTLADVVSTKGSSLGTGGTHAVSAWHHPHAPGSGIHAVTKRTIARTISIS